MAKGLFKLLSLVLLSTSIAGLFVVAGYADTLKSNNYQFAEPAVGFDGLVQSSSTNYQSLESVGGSAVGNYSSNGYQVQAGATTTADPTLSFAVNGTSANFGSFSPSSAATATSSFTVLDYTSYGYAVQIFGTAPTNGAYTIASMPTATASTAGTEQFGINLVANTSPTTFGANPVYGLFGVGSAATNYNIANLFRYVNGDIIATAPKSSGVTTYTISYIVNTSSITPSGLYTSNQSIICTGTY